MKKFVENTRANEQINLIYSQVQQGKSPENIAEHLTNNRVVNLKSNIIEWSKEDIEKIIDSFNLNTIDKGSQASSYRS